MRWVLWGGVLLIWTLALLTTRSVHVTQEVVPPSAYFPTVKLAHVGAYAVLAVLSAWLPVGRRVRWLLFLFLSLHAVATEFLQQFVPERSPSWRDIGLDHLGLLLGMAVAWYWERRRITSVPVPDIADRALVR
jgi:VanZ family protein